MIEDPRMQTLADRAGLDGAPVDDGIGSGPVADRHADDARDRGFGGVPRQFDNRPGRGTGVALELEPRAEAVGGLERCRG